MRVRASLIICLVLLSARTSAALDHVAFVRNDKTMQVAGRLLVEAQDGGLLVQDQAGVLWAITPQEKTSHHADESAFAPYDKETLGKQLLAELPAGFKTHTTAHYLIVYNTSSTYAQWCGGLYERLYAAFTNYWDKRGFQLEDPAFPLVALVFDDKDTFAAYSRAELGEATSVIIGYFSLATNRVTMYDLTGADALRGNSRGGSTEHINRILSRPEAERTVATIIHEATHQLAFNCGLHQRYADIPLWLSEGVAIYFETPDLKSSRGWRGMGNVNHVRLADFRRYLPTRPADSLTTLLATDERFRNGRTAPQAYAEAWAFTYFLLRKYPQQYQNYLRRLAAKKPLIFDSQEERLTAVRDAFRKELQELDQEFVRFTASLR